MSFHVKLDPFRLMKIFHKCDLGLPLPPNFQHNGSHWLDIMATPIKQCPHAWDYWPLCDNKRCYPFECNVYDSWIARGQKIWCQLIFFFSFSAWLKWKWMSSYMAFRGVMSPIIPHWQNSKWKIYAFNEAEMTIPYGKATKLLHWQSAGVSWLSDLENLESHENHVNKEMKRKKNEKKLAFTGNSIPSPF